MLSGDLHYLCRIKKKKFFDGVYLSWDGASISGVTPYERDRYIVGVHQSTKKLFECLSAPQALPPQAKGNNGALSLLLATILNSNGVRRTAVLDFGGGGGGDFLAAKLCLPNCPSFDYHVLDLPETISFFKRHNFYDDETSRQLHLHDSLESLEGLKVDLVYAGSSLQYLPSLSPVLKKLEELGAHYFMVANTPMFIGDHASFVTCQVNNPGIKTRLWVRNFSELLEEFQQIGYELSYVSSAPSAHMNFDFVSHLSLQMFIGNLLLCKSSVLRRAGEDA